jgi:SAM-dependent methyltransferase
MAFQHSCWLLSEARFYDFMGFDPAFAIKVRGFYLPFFEGCDSVLDIACGRGEFLGVLKRAGISGVGVDLDPLMVRAARAAGHQVEEADAFEYLGERRAAFDGIFSAHFIEHLPAERVSKLFELAFRALRPGGRLVVCTPNAAALPTLQRHFWWDATHVRLYDVDLLRFLVTEAGFAGAEGGVNPHNHLTGPVDLETLRPPPEGPRRGAGRLVSAISRRVLREQARMREQLYVVSSSLAALLRDLYVPNEVYVTGTKP